MNIFGKRFLNPSRHIVPPKTWADPEAASFFERIGAKPNDPDNLRVTAADVERMRKEGLAQIAAKIAALQAKAREKGYADLKLRPFWLIQDVCWNGDLGEFLLIRLRLNPYENWNTVILPADLEGARWLGLPVHPGAEVAAFATIGKEVVDNLRAEVMQAISQAQRHHEFGRVVDVCETSVAKIKKMATMFAEEMMRANKAATDGVWLKNL